MVIGNGFFSDSEEDALREMKSRCGCDVRRCAFPTMGNLVYYISEHGDLYSMQIVKGTGKFITRGPKRPASAHSNGKRSDNGITHRLNESPKKERWVSAELLVYCTFCIGRWEPDLKVEFVNGITTDLRPDNLRLHREDIPAEWQQRMIEFSDLYQHEFKRVAESVKYWCGISLEDAKDITQSVFIWLCTNGYRDLMNVEIWIYWAKRRAIDFFYHHLRHYNTEDYDVVIEIKGRTDTPYEVELRHLQPGEKRRRYLTLWTQGHKPTEIAEMTGSTLQNVSSSVTRSIQFLQKYLKHEKKYLR